jgi:hypothetical protein
MARWPQEVMTKPLKVQASTHIAIQEFYLDLSALSAR